MKSFAVYATILLLLATCINVFSQQPKRNMSQGERSITLDYLDQKQQINMVGGDMERSQSFLQKAANPQEIADWSFKDIPFNACRVSYDKKQELAEGVKNFAFYNDAIKSMKMVKASNPEIRFYATMKSDYNGYNNENNLPDWICDYKPTTFFDVAKYAVFLADYLELMHQNGVTIHYMAVAKEWTQVVTPERTVAIIKSLKPLLAARQVPIPLFVDPGTWAVYQGVSFINSIVGINEQELFHAFTTHEYNNSASHYPSFVSAAKGAGNFAWNPESGIGAGGRTSGVEPLDMEALLGTYSSKASMYQAGIEGELFFEIFSRGVNAETRSIYFTSGNLGYRMRSYYVMKLFGSNILNRRYVPLNISGINNIASMAFVNEKEMALWIINNGTEDYQDIALTISNTTIEGKATKISFDANSPIEGSAEVLKQLTPGHYTVGIKSKSVNFIRMELDKEALTDNFEIDNQLLDFGFVTTTAAAIEREINVNAENMGSNIQLSIEGAGASSFEIVNQPLISSTALLWNHKVKVRFQSPIAGRFEAVLNLSSSTVSKQVSLIGETFVHEAITAPFIEEFPGLTVNNGPINNSILNTYSTHKGWEIKNGLNTGTDRINISSKVGNEGHIITPEITFAGPFEVKFFARMLSNDIGTTTADKVKNNIPRNIYAMIGGDTIYDHKLSGATLYQNYNEWICSYVFEGPGRIKFMPQVSDQGAWASVNDGLSFGPKTSSIRVQPTSLPAVNIAYGQTINLGEVVADQPTNFRFPLKGYNLNNPIELSLPNSGKIVLAKNHFIPDIDGLINEDVVITLASQDLNPGVYTELLTLTGEAPSIRTRNIWLQYEVVLITNVSSPKTPAIAIKTGKNMLTIETKRNEKVEIYSITGVLQYQQIINGKKNFNLGSGVYIVKSNHQTQKVIVK